MITKGIWRQHDYYWITADTQEIAQVALISDKEGNYTESQANARLIAAAPALLAALIDLQAEMRRSHGLMNVKIDYSLMVADVAASKAIDKAKGA